MAKFSTTRFLVCAALAAQCRAATTSGAGTPTWIGVTLAQIYSPNQGLQAYYTTLNSVGGSAGTLGSSFFPGSFQLSYLQSGAFACVDASGSNAPASAWVTTYDAGAQSSTVWHVVLNGTVLSRTVMPGYGITALTLSTGASTGGVPRVYVTGMPCNAMDTGMQGVYWLDATAEQPVVRLAVNMTSIMSMFEYGTAGGLVVDDSTGRLYMQTSTSYVYPVTGAGTLYTLDPGKGAVESQVGQSMTYGALWMEQSKGEREGAVGRPVLQLTAYYLNYSQPQNGQYPDPATFTTGALDPASGVYTPTLLPFAAPQDILGVGFMGTISAVPPGLLPSGNTRAAILGTVDRNGYWILAFNSSGAEGRAVDVLYRPRSPSSPLYAACTVAV